MHTVVAVVAVMALALPASGMPTSDLVRVSSWSSAVEVSGLDQPDTEQVEALWGEFVAGSPAHAACLVETPPVIEARSDMRPRAAYAPSSGTLYVKPGDLPRLVVFHELAHHLDFTCGGADQIGDEFRAAQGLSASKAWWNEGSPVTWPAEYFANAVAISLGEESRHGVSSAAVEVVEEWMGRTATPAPEPPPVLIIGEVLGDIPYLS